MEDDPPESSMNKIFEVHFASPRRNATIVNVLATTAEQACIDALRHARKNYQNDAEVISVRKVLEIQVEYKTPARRRS